MTLKCANIDKLGVITRAFVQIFFFSVSQKSFLCAGPALLGLKKNWFTPFADEDKGYGGNLDRMNTRVILDHTGKCKWLAPIIIKTKCPIDVEFFPFDHQVNE